MRVRWLALLVLVSTILTSNLTSLAQEASPVPTSSTPVAVDTAACQVGRQEDGSVVLPTDQIIRPAGEQIEFLGRPNDVAVNPVGKTAAYLTVPNSDSASPKAPIVIVNLTTGEVVQNFDPGAEPGVAQPSYTGIAYSADGSKLFASDFTGSISVSSVGDDGSVTLDRTLVVDAVSRSPSTVHRSTWRSIRRTRSRSLILPPAR